MVTMKERTAYLYSMMDAEINQCDQNADSLLNRTECCFRVCEKYRAQLSEETATYVFDSVEDEIDFFKNIKPRFTARVEYYSFLYHAEMFKPGNNDLIDIRDFWKRQIIRLERFVNSNQELYKYYKEGKTDKDTLYFMRRKEKPFHIPVSVYTEREMAFVGADRIISSFIALEQYKKFAEEQLQLVSRDK